MSEQVPYYVYRTSSGEVLQAGNCNEDQVALQAHRSGTAVRVGLAEPGSTLVSAGGDVLDPLGNTPFTPVGAGALILGVENLVNPTTIRWPFGVVRVRSGRFMATTPTSELYTLQAAGYLPVEVTMIGIDVDIGDNIF